MNRDEARTILRAYRPGTADAGDRDVVEALALAETDAELAAWLDRHLESQKRIRTSLRRIEPPEDLRQEILDAHERFVKPGLLKHGWIPWAAAAVLAVSAIVVSLLPPKQSESRTFRNFRDRMVATAIREYRMDIETNDASAVQTFLDERDAGLQLPIASGLAGTPLFGAGYLTWKGNPVAMVCFKSESTGLLFLFAVDRTSVEQPPGPEAQFSSLSDLNVASWSAGSKAFVLAGELQREKLAGLLRTTVQ